MRLLIEVKNVSFKYNSGSNQNGVKNINLKIGDGETVLITGKSGCGKTTITRLINGLIPNFYEGKLSGEVLINGNNISKEFIYNTAKYVGSVFQNHRSQFFNVDTTSELAFPSENQGIKEEEIKKRIEKAVNIFKIENLMNRSIFKLSGGEKQKIGCASISVSGSEVVVLDEPSSNLDSFAIDDLRNVLEIWKKERKTIIIAEHRLYFMRELADRMIIMDNGSIVEEVSSQKLRSMSLEETTKKGIRTLDIKQLDYIDKEIKDNKNKLKIYNFNFKYKNADRGIEIDNLCISKQSIVAVIGRNGSGKSTFAKCLCGLLKGCDGILEIDNNRCKNKDRIKKCYMVMQDVNHQLFTESVLDEVLLSMNNKKISYKQKINMSEEILDSLNLLEFKEFHPMSLSGGQKQRVAIASAIASNREIIILDEPTSGLDYVHMNQVGDNLKKLRNMGKTVFVITHDPEFILNCCTDIIHLEDGRVNDFYRLDSSTVDRLKNFMNYL